LTAVTGSIVNRKWDPSDKFTSGERCQNRDCKTTNEAPEPNFALGFQKLRLSILRELARRCHSEQTEAATQRAKSASPGFQSLTILALGIN
jgi:hypothetical protein